MAERTRRRVTVRLIPFLFALYVLAYLDRVNISVAQLGMELPPGEGGLGFDRAVIGFGAGVFFWGYWILEIPSTLSVVRWGARWVLARVLILWGICATLTGLIGTPFAARMFGWLPEIAINPAALAPFDAAGDWLFGGPARLFGSEAHWHPATSTLEFFNRLRDTPQNQFYFLRFLLGLFEGGFFPSVIFYLSSWFRGRDRSKAIAGFMAAIPLSNVLGLPVSGLLLGVDWLGLPGWRWILILEGFAPVLAGVATLFLLTDRPEQARWLPPEERDWLTAELRAEQQNRPTPSHWAWAHHLGLVTLLTLVYFGQNVTSYGLGMFMPAIIKSQSGLSNQSASYLAAIPYAVALAGMLVLGWHSDRSGERVGHVAFSLAMLGLGILLAALLDGVPVLPVVVMVVVAGPFLHAHVAAFWPIPTTFLGSAAAASAIGFINMIGNLGGSVGPMIVGRSSGGNAGFAPALFRLAPWPLASAAIILIVGLWYRRPVNTQTPRV